MENSSANPNKPNRTGKAKLNSQFLDRASILKHGGASLAVYIIITAFHQLFPLAWQNAYVIRWIACISCIMVSYLFFLQEIYRDQLAYFLMIVNGLGMFLSCSGINAIHNDIAQSVISESNDKKHKRLGAMGQNLELASVDFNFLFKPINWWQSEEEIKKLHSVDSLADEVTSLKQQIHSLQEQCNVDISGATKLDPLKISTKYNDDKNLLITDEHFAVVAATKMNTLYIGLDNPLRISVPGISLKDIDVSLFGKGSIKKTNEGQYYVRVDSSGGCRINVFAQVGNRRKFIDSALFHVKRIPDPIPMTSGKLRGGNIQPGTMRSQTGILAYMENFDFESNFRVESFELLLSSKGEIFKAESQGSGFTPTMQTLIDRAKPKDIIFIDEIKVVGPDKQRRKLGQISFVLI